MAELTVKDRDTGVVEVLHLPYEVGTGRLDGTLPARLAEALCALQTLGYRARGFLDATYQETPEGVAYFAQHGGAQATLATARTLLLG